MTPARNPSQREEQAEARPSRSELKRRSAALQKLGERVAALPAAQRNLLPLPPELREALEEGDHLRDREAKRRHNQYIGRIMREAGEAGELDELLQLADFREMLNK